MDSLCSNFRKGGEALSPSLENGVWWIGDYQMLETSQERVKLLKSGIDGKTIEKL